MPQNAKFCLDCGTKINECNEELSSESSVIKTGAGNNSKNKRSNLIVVLIAIIVFTVGGSILYFNNPEKKAIRFANGYFSAMKNAESTVEYTSANVDEYFNVLNYKYLSTYAKAETINQFVLSYDVEVTNGYGQKIYKKMHVVVKSKSDGKYEIDELIY